MSGLIMRAVVNTILLFAVLEAVAVGFLIAAPSTLTWGLAVCGFVLLLLAAAGAKSLIRKQPGRDRAGEGLV